MVTSVSDKILMMRANIYDVDNKHASYIVLRFGEPTEMFDTMSPHKKKRHEGNKAQSHQIQTNTHANTRALSLSYKKRYDILYLLAFR